MNSARALVAVLLLLAAALAQAHSSSTAYLTINPGATPPILTYRIALRDADALLDLDANGDGSLTWGEVEDRGVDLRKLAGQALALSTPAGDCPLEWSAPKYARDADNGYAEMSAPLTCAANSASLTLDYRLFAGIDGSHRLLLRVGRGAPQLLAPESRTELGPIDAAVAPSLRGLVAQGITHILSGPDHLMFLLALLLPAVLVRRDGRWHAREDLRGALVQVAWIATAFTLAHSLTLALASFGVVRIPAAVIEPLIALTVLLAALNNLWPLVQRRLAFVAFAFGLVHGFGFAEVLAPLHLPTADLALALVAFNGGVEIGQLIAVAASFALLAAARRWRGYPRWVLGAGSSFVAAIAIAWIIERVFDVPLFAVLAG